MCHMVCFLVHPFFGVGFKGKLVETTSFRGEPPQMTNSHAAHSVLPVTFACWICLDCAPCTVGGIMEKTIGDSFGLSGKTGVQMQQGGTGSC